VKAYHHALSLAEHYRARLVAHHVIELWRYPSLGFAPSVESYQEFCRSIHEIGHSQLREFVTTHARENIQPELVVEQGSAPDAILSFAQTHKTELIVMGTHGRRGYDRLMLGSVTDRVMRRSPCPVVAVSKLPDNTTATCEERHAHRLNRILFCADFSKHSARALNYAIEATAEYDAELTLLHVLEEAPSAARSEQVIAATTERLEKLIPSKESKTLRIKTAVCIGEPYQQIIRLALAEQIDMVAMGVRGRGSLDLAVFGSTTYRVMQLGSCPVLVHV
jgi:nucleotide-binding universal stress UspA family protein